jgi:Raf kinase inhibitor-like YbhB/YbcL family protein
MNRILRIGFWMWAILMALGACQGAGPTQEGGGEIQVESSAFEDRGTIPQCYTCDGEDLSPPLQWSEPPSATVSQVLICDDPDAPVGTWDHWVLFNLPATVNSLPEGVQGMGVSGNNGWQKLGYGGPCPPSGSAHSYVFKVYALDITLDLGAGASKRDVERAMKGHILAEGQLIGRYGR